MKPVAAIFVVDGMRPDAMLEADTPNFRRMLETGATTLAASSVTPSVTLPCHMSIFRGVDVSRHGITTNLFQPLARPVKSLFDVATEAGLRCGMFYNWGALRDLCDPFSLAVSMFNSNNDTLEGDQAVCEAAARAIPEEDLDLAFIYLGNTDSMGHKAGWMSDEQLRAISNADDGIAKVIEAIQGTDRGYTALVLADHGGHEQCHGTLMPEDMTIPWMLTGTNVPQRKLTTPVRLFDTCPTIASLLDVPGDSQWEGAVIEEALS